MVLCDGNYDWVHMACTRCIIGNPSEAGNHLVIYNYTHIKYIIYNLYLYNIILHELYIIYYIIYFNIQVNTINGH